MFQKLTNDGNLFTVAKLKTIDNYNVITKWRL